MGNAIAESPALPYKNRRGWLIAFGVVEILLGAISLLLCAFISISQLHLKTSYTSGTPGAVGAANIIIGAGFYLVAAAFFLAAGIGSILRRNWARILMLIGSAFWVFVGVLGTVFALFLLPWFMAAQHSVAPAAQHVKSLVLGFMDLMAIVFGILLPLTFLIFYTRKSVKATCLARTAASGVLGKRSQALPTQVIIMVVWESLAAISVWSFLFSPMRATCVFGYIVRGWTMILIMVGFSALSVVAAWLIYKMLLAGWTLAFWKLLFFSASTGVSLATGSMSRLFGEMGQTPAQEQLIQLFPQFITDLMVITLIGSFAYLGFLIYSRRFFSSATNPVAS